MSQDRYGVVGHPVAQSWSPFIHGLFARQTGQDISYRLYDFTPDQFVARVRDFFILGGKGLNVTVPHKVAAAELAAVLTPRARHAGAVNTLALQEDGRLVGDNTDGAGLVRDLCDNLGVVITRCRVLILGAGGATRGIAAPLLALEPATLVVANRTSERALALASAFASLGCIEGVGLESLTGEGFDLVINATSASLRGEIPPLPAGVVGTDTICYDLAYSRSGTAFTAWATGLGCRRAFQGWGMLVEQAAESFRLWRGVRPATAPVLAALNERAVTAS